MSKKKHQKTKDDFAGVGGSYVVDKKTGKRTLKDRTAETLVKKPATDYIESKAAAPEPEKQEG